MSALFVHVLLLAPFTLAVRGRAERTGNEVALFALVLVPLVALVTTMMVVKAVAMGVRDRAFVKVLVKAARVALPLAGALVGTLVALAVGDWMVYMPYFAAGVYVYWRLR